MQLNYNSGNGDLKNWLIKEDYFDRRYINKCEAIFTQGNGYLGIRNALDERYIGEIRNTFITGTFNKASENEVTELPNVADMTATKIIINGNEFSLTEGKILSYARTFNLKNGESIRKITWESPDGIILELVFKRFVSLADEHLLVSKIEVEADRAASISIESGIDGSVTNSGAMHLIDIERRIYDKKYMEFISRTNQSDVYIIQDCLCKLNLVSKILPVMGRRTLNNKYSLDLEKGTKLSFEKISVLYSSRDKLYVDYEKKLALQMAKEEALESIKKYEVFSYEELLRLSEFRWEEYWKESDITIGTKDDFASLAIRFALYHLKIMVKGDDNRLGIGAKALSGEGYKGHSFWDTEIFILPYFTFTHPEIARTLLEYRYHNLYGARKKAKEYGYEGAMYPWECAFIDDGEVTPLYMGADVVTGELTKVWTGIIEHHITADIVYAINQYENMTSDNDYMEKYGYEIILEAGLFWASRLEYIKEKDRYEIRNVIGPDEYKEHVDNNAYTNYMAYYTMNLCLEKIAYLKEKNIDLYKRLDEKLNITHIKNSIEMRKDKLYLPKANTEGLIPQSDSYLSLKKLDISKYKNSKEVLGIYEDYNTKQLNEYMVSKQSDTVMLLFLFRDLLDKNLRKKNFDFYEDKTLHDSSLSKSTHAILANEFDEEDMAYNLFKGAISIDLGENMKSSTEGIHSAAMGGIWATYVLGFGGVWIDDKGLSINPHLPKEWEYLEFPLVYKKTKIRVRVEKQGVKITKISGEAIDILLKGEKIHIN